MSEPNIIGFMRVKNEAGRLARAIESILPLVDKVFVFDDHSTDNTLEVAKSFDEVVAVESIYDGIDEARDKESLVALGWAMGPYYHLDPSNLWGFFLDGDELLEPGGDVVIKNAIRSGIDSTYTFRFVYLWNDEGLQRVDGVYASMWRQSCWKMDGDHRFLRTRFGGNFHCGSTPAKFMNRPAYKCPARILHLGYLTREERVRKYEWYNQIDPGNQSEDFYRHMVVGDLFPESARFRFGGPLRLEFVESTVPPKSEQTTPPPVPAY